MWLEHCQKFADIHDSCYYLCEQTLWFLHHCYINVACGNRPVAVHMAQVVHMLFVITFEAADEA